MCKQKYFSLIYSDRLKRDMLFLGPVAFCNHACNPNSALKCNFKKESGILAIKNIKVDEEITVFYGRNYFENNNECVLKFDVSILYIMP